MANALLNPMIDAFVSPEGLAAIMSGKKPDIAKHDSQENINSEESSLSMGYETLNQFVVRVSNKDKTAGETLLVFSRDGLTWKLSAVIFPDLQDTH